MRSALVRAKLEFFEDLLKDPSNARASILCSPTRFPPQLTAARFVMPWLQRDLIFPKKSSGFHLITREVVGALPELANIEIGLLHIFIQHTSASLTINENADPDVPADLETSFSAIAPEDFPYQHTIEGPDDMPAHVKASMLGSSVSIPVSHGQLCLGTWQGIYLCEHRRHGGRRKVVLTLWGQKGVTEDSG